MENEIFLITKLEENSIDDMLNLQEQAIQNGNNIMRSSKELYERAFKFQNFVYGLRKYDNNQLLGFCNCSIPTQRASINLGKNRVPYDELDFVGHVNTIIVDTSYRQKGFGKQIIQKVLDNFRSQKIKYIFTVVSPNNTASMKLFTHFQFSVIEKITYNGQERNILKLNENRI